MNKLISVIVPIYKVEEWLDECVSTIVNQTYKNLEVILVDDGSPDRCPLICDEWERKDERVKVIHKKNGGLSSARNAGLEIAKGDYISFIDSDDYLDLKMYEVMLHNALKYNADVVKCGRFTDRKGEIERVHVVDSDRIYNNSELLDCFLYHRDDFCSGVWDKLFKKELFDNLRFPEGLNSEDYYVYADIFSKSNVLYYTNRPLYYYRIRDNSISRVSEIDNHSFDKIIVSDMVYDMIRLRNPEKINDAEIFQAIARFSIYNKTMCQKHDKCLEKEWKCNLKEKLKAVWVNKKVKTVFKLKYLAMTICPKVYIKIKGNYHE